MGTAMTAARGNGSVGPPRPEPERKPFGEGGPTWEGVVKRGAL